ncbi:hypothetical protein Q5H91_11495 [Sphingomonas sp. KR1UV-12]|uniref:LPXTG cell wall anchor domain-containing protein n=1 Tax=Sphingomonas aurea TaxID=3063994 RepID=A0ABT9EM04_9SPHN|nr:hypothetical protein [Sphingomonas sp. KR1UV-12]MDP1027841.1 hypothetical protein [Sphingomonas sp. KR1UV-12]
MSHSPPVPPGNQSPFPREEPPHPPAPAKAKPPRDEQRAPEGNRLIVPLVAAVGIGALATLAGAFFLRSKKADKPRRKRRSAKPSRRATD